MNAYYNEIDPFAAQWLRNLIKAGHIADGIVDERSIEDVCPSDLREFTQCHFFAGIGVWSRALRLARWPDDRRVWTGSCPCQPFSAAGKGAGFADERHLWPALNHLILQCRPPIVLGEQVASSDAGPWLDLVQTDVEAMGYAFGAVAFPAASVGAPHIRDRTYWVADAGCTRGKRWQDACGLDGNETAQREQNSSDDQPCGSNGVVGNTHDARPQGLGGDGHINGAQGWADAGRHSRSPSVVAGGMGEPESNRPKMRGHVHRGLSGQGFDQGCDIGGLADAEQHGHRRETEPANHIGAQTNRSADQHGGHSDALASRPSPTNGHWSAADWLLCRDGKWRPVEPGTFPLAHGATGRVGRLRAYGNAIVAQAAQAFIGSVM